MGDAITLTAAQGEQLTAFPDEKDHDASVLLRKAKHLGALEAVILDGEGTACCARLGGVLGIAVLASIFARRGVYESPQAFIDGGNGAYFANSGDDVMRSGRWLRSWTATSAAS
jgi:hypothetical protein